MKQVFLRFTLIGALCLINLVGAFAQTVVTGKVVDEKTSEPIIGASVTIGSGTNLKGAVTDMDGKFTLETPSTATITFRSVGYQTQTRTIRNAGRKVNLGEIELSYESTALDVVTVIASVVPKDRITPVPVSNIKLADIESKSFNTEFPELVKSTPSVYVTKSGGGFGDSRMALRGFDMTNIGVLINGVPINDMENGKVYFSNWAGLTDVASFIQIQRGIGASRLAISSVGGTMNIVTKNVDAKRGGMFFSGIANDGYLKYGFNFSTGLMENGWAVTASGSTSYGDGYIKGTDFRGYNYFLNVSKKINEQHTLSFTAFGAPQWHNQRSSMYTQKQYEENPDGIRMNLEYGILEGKVYSPKYNWYHKPQISLNHLWKIDNKSTLSTAVYASFARGGGRNAAGLQPVSKEDKDNGIRDYRNYITAYKGQLSKEALRTNDNLIDWESVYGMNAANGDAGSKVILANSVNQHNWYGILSTYQNKLDENFTLTAGFDGRYYVGEHYKEVENLLGGKYFATGDLVGRDYDIVKIGDEDKKVVKKGEMFDYYNKGRVVWGGLFAQGEYRNDYISAFLSGSLSYQSYRYDVPYLYSSYNYDKLISENIRDVKKSDVKTFIPISIKGGLSYKFLDYNNIFVNAGYFTRAPKFAGVFLNYSTELNKNVKNEKILTFEAGYGFSNEFVGINFGGYYTKWDDRFLRRSGSNRDFYNFTNMSATHKGLELEVNARPLDNLKLTAMASLGDWKWGNKTHFDIYDDKQKNIGQGEIDLNGIHVGNSAQTTFALGFDWEAFENLHLRGNLNFFGKNYADFEPAYRVGYDKDKKEYVTNYSGDAWKMPNYTLVDLSASYKLNMDKVSVSFFGGVNNLFNKKYISDATDGSKLDKAGKRTGEDALVWYGFGRTWQVGMRVNF
ncbi:TonB-dependent receptor [Falsiporphyromonas endometrii]|uniref:TonB-dependent receptor n=1 Tax=Falsiporphyromonas endometrii TaxID=1387297 RepID=A0ABV9K6A0_9PORP